MVISSGGIGTVVQSGTVRKVSGPVSELPPLRVALDEAA